MAGLEIFYGPDEDGWFPRPHYRDIWSWCPPQGGCIYLANSPAAGRFVTVPRLSWGLPYTLIVARRPSPVTVSRSPASWQEVLCNFSQEAVTYFPQAEIHQDAVVYRAK